MIRWLVPRRAVRRLVDLDPAELVGLGIRGVILDVDNTLLGPEETAPSPEVVAWMEALGRAGLRAVLVSNTLPSRLRRICERLGCPAVGGLPKPNPWRLRRAMAVLRTRPAQTAAIGDQLFTDVLPANLLGLYTVLVEPLEPREFPTTRILRWVERLVGRDRIFQEAGEQEPASEGRTRIPTDPGRRWR